MGAHRTTQCDRCDWTFTGSKRDSDQAYGVHLVEVHPHILEASALRAPSGEVTATVTDLQAPGAKVGHHCPKASAITPLHDGWCDWCGKAPKPQYEWFEPTGLRPFWRPLVSAA